MLWVTRSKSVREAEECTLLETGRQEPWEYDILPGKSGITEFY